MRWIMNKGRTKVGDFFVSYGWACVCIIVASVVLFEVGIRSMNAVKDHEKINYFIEFQVRYKLIFWEILSF